MHLGHASKLLSYHLRNNQAEAYALGVHRLRVLQAAEQLEQLGLVMVFYAYSVIEDT